MTDLSITYENLDRVIAVGNGKGGVLKTAIVANLGLSLQDQDMNVLLIDLDPQGNLTQELGLVGDRYGDDNGEALAQALLGQGPLQPQPTGRKGVSILYGGHKLRNADRHLTVQSAMSETGTVNSDNDNGIAYHALARPLNEIANDFDLILIDCPPGAQTLLQVALGASRWLLVPARDDEASRRGLQVISADVQAAWDADVAGAEPLAVVLVGSPANATAKRRVATENLKADTDIPVAEATIRGSSQATTARYLGLSAQELDGVASRLPNYHAMKKMNPKEVDLSGLPETPRLTRMQSEDSGPDGNSLLTLLRGAAGGNLAGLAADYSALADELFSRIEEKEVAEIKRLADSRPVSV